ncbi:uncharacterized protein LOC118695088 [Molothrus ater]|uniref:uncharacterized protein LOC118695088 n=1 Tax=Molothrus ater TaxID=84834 RepID=UPI00174E2FB9|nr:uncharacterized protein LOC118695088 [Molothrus ater]
MAVFSHPDTATPTIAEATKRERKENLQNNTPQSLRPRPGGKPVPRTAGTIRRSPSPATTGGQKRRNTSRLAAAAPRGSPRAPSATFLPSRCLPTSSRSRAETARPGQQRHPRPPRHPRPQPPARCGPATHLSGERSPRLPLLQEPLFPSPLLPAMVAASARSRIQRETDSCGCFPRSQLLLLLPPSPPSPAQCSAAAPWGETPAAPKGEAAPAAPARKLSGEG